MSIIRGKIKVTDHKASKGQDALKYNISYDISNSEDDQKKNSYTIISALKGNRNLLIEVDSTLINQLESKREACVIDFIKSIRTLGIEYRYRKSANAGGQSFLGKLFSMGNKSNDAHQVFCLITDEAWNNESLASSLPLYGVRYYIFKEGVDESKILDDIYNGQLLDFEIYDYFSLIAFDCCSYGQMGIYTESVSKDDIKKLLKL